MFHWDITSLGRRLILTPPYSDSDASFDLGHGALSHMRDKGVNSSPHGTGNCRGSLSSNEKSFAEELLALNSNSANSGCDQDAKVAYLQLRLLDALRQLGNEKQ